MSLFVFGTLPLLPLSTTSIAYYLELMVCHLIKLFSNLHLIFPSSKFWFYVISIPLTVQHSQFSFHSTPCCFLGYSEDHLELHMFWRHCKVIEDNYFFSSISHYSPVAAGPIDLSNWFATSNVFSHGGPIQPISLRQHVSGLPFGDLILDLDLLATRLDPPATLPFWPASPTLSACLLLLRLYRYMFIPNDVEILFPLQVSTSLHRSQVDIIAWVEEDVSSSLAMVVDRSHHMTLQPWCPINYARFVGLHLTQPDLVEPRGIKEALSSPSWTEAVKEELSALSKIGKWSLIRPPFGANLVSCWWVFKVERHKDGSFARRKACLVACGFNQVEGVNFYSMWLLV